MHPFLRPSLAGSIAIVSVAILGAFALLVFVPIGGRPKVSPMATPAPEAINQNAPIIALTEGEVHEPQVSATTTRGDRLPSPLGSLLPTSAQTAEVAALKPAEAFDYAQADRIFELRWRNAVLTDGVPAVEAACAEAIAHGVHSADVVLNILARQRDPGPPAMILTPAALTLRHAPTADCARYDNPRRTI